MNIFDEISSIYNDIDNIYAVAEANARSRGHYIKEKRMQRKRELNDLAYFLFMFTRLEGHITTVVNDLLTEKFDNLSRWSERRSWEVLKSRKVALMDKVALLTPIGQSDYNLVKMYYEQRNKIAHGQAFTIPINIPTTTTHFKGLYTRLK